MLAKKKYSKNKNKARERVRSGSLHNQWRILVTPSLGRVIPVIELGHKPMLIPIPPKGKVLLKRPVLLVNI